MGRLAAQLGYTNDEPGLKDNLGLHWDRDTVAFCGDPAWEARLAPQPARFTQKLSVENPRYTFTLKADADCSPGRPPAMLLPHRVKDITIIKGQEMKPLVTSKFIMVMVPGQLKKARFMKSCSQRRGCRVGRACESHQDAWRFLYPPCIITS